MEEKNYMRTTYMAKPSEVERKWYIVDATDQVLGRLSVDIAVVLRGKNKPTFTPHVDGGDYVVVVNAEKVALTGNKRQNKMYYQHSGYAGGLKHRTAEEMFAKQPQKVIELAVRGMLPAGPLGDDMYRRLHVYCGNEHPHQAQKPEALPRK
jgi:large subunit ribosomal protein L13